MKEKSGGIQYCKEDRILNVVISAIMGFMCIIVLYPLIYVISSSFSSGNAVSSGKVLLWPVDFSITGYKIVFGYKAVWTSYLNTIFYTVVGVAINIILTTLAAYPLSRKSFTGKGIYLVLFMIPMWFSGGIIPKYLLMTKLGFVNTRWSVILHSALSIYNMIVMMTFFRNSIPYELYEAAKIDGITDVGYLFYVVIPLSKAVFAVITLYYAVSHWNSYFSAMLYLRDGGKYPLQLVLREILNASNFDLSEMDDPVLMEELRHAADTMKYALIVISTVPMMIAYPLVQKFFKKGVMIGSVKG